jgi:hypothetical protein
MEESTKVGGTEVNNMDWAFTSTVQRSHKSMGFGKTEDELAGSMTSKLC